MFNTLAILCRSDFYGARSWFVTKTVSKVIIFLGFLFVLIGAGILVYMGIDRLFYSLFPFANFGRLTADYIVKASLVVIAALGLGSSIVTSSNLLFSPSKNNLFLITLPIKERYLVIWLWLKTILSNWFFMLLLILPISLAYRHIFSHQYFLDCLANTFLVSLVLSLLTTSLGGFVSLFFSQLPQKFAMQINFASVIVFITVLVGLFRYILPFQISELTTASPDRFYPIYNQLPLVKYELSWIYVIIFSLLSATAFLLIQVKNFIGLSLELSASTMSPRYLSHQGLPRFSVLKLSYQGFGSVLSSKDLINIIRSPIESSYGLFLLLLLFGFFGLLSHANISGYSLKEWVNYLVIFTYGGLMFFANTYLLRLVFPLFSQESSSSWFLFSLPIRPQKILHSKIFTALVLTLPLAVSALVIWYILPFVANYQSILAISAIEIVSFLSISQLFIGAIWPNFLDGASPEKVSTTGTGLITLAATSIVVFLSTFGVYQVSTQNLSSLTFISLQTLFIIPILLIMYIFAKNSVKKYQF